MKTLILILLQMSIMEPSHFNSSFTNKKKPQEKRYQEIIEYYLVPQDKTQVNSTTLLLHKPKGDDLSLYINPMKLPLQKWEFHFHNRLAIVPEGVRLRARKTRERRFYSHRPRL